MFAGFFKGFLLVGILLWYSIAIFTVINDYFRIEFNTYIKKQPLSPAPAKPANPANPANPTNPTDPTNPTVPPPATFAPEPQQSNEQMEHTNWDNNINKVVEFVQQSGENKMQCRKDTAQWDRTGIGGAAMVVAVDAIGTKTKTENLNNAKKY